MAQPTSSFAVRQQKISRHNDHSEQEQRRVIVLEQLLRDERLKHCWQLQQLDAIHKSELSSLGGNWSTNNSVHSSSVRSPGFPSNSVNQPIDMRERTFMHDGMNDGWSSYRTDEPAMRNASAHRESNGRSFHSFSSPATAAPSSSASSASSSSSSSSSRSKSNITESSPLAAAKAAALLAATGIEEALAAIRELETEESYRLSMDQPITSYPPNDPSSKQGSTPKEAKRSSYSHVSFSPVVLRMGGQESANSSVDGWYQSPKRHDVTQNTIGEERGVDDVNGDDLGARRNNVNLFSSPKETRSTTSATTTTAPPQDASNGIVEASMSDTTFLHYIESFQSDLRRLHDTPINVTTPS